MHHKLYLYFMAKMCYLSSSWCRLISLSKFEISYLLRYSTYYGNKSLISSEIKYKNLTFYVVMSQILFFYLKLNASLLMTDFLHKKTLFYQ